MALCIAWKSVSSVGSVGLSADVPGAVALKVPVFGSIEIVVGRERLPELGRSGDLKYE